MVITSVVMMDAVTTGDIKSGLYGLNCVVWIPNMQCFEFSNLVQQNVTIGFFKAIRIIPLPCFLPYK